MSDIAPANVLPLANDDWRKIVLVATLLCLICSTIVATVAIQLRPLQLKNAQHTQKVEILKIAGLLSTDDAVEDDFNRYIQVRLVDLENGSYTQHIDPSKYDQRVAARNEATSVILTRQEDIAQIQRRANFSRVYLIHHSDGVLKTIILPVYGYGLWSTMYGFIGLSSDGRTIRGLTFYEQNETAGLGAEISSTTWLAQFTGKQALDTNGKPVINVAKGLASADESIAYTVDGISGASLTGRGVTNMLQFWLGQSGFGPYLKRLRDGG